jgi:sporulation protein YlmC with PRC-barrel domain
MKKFQRSLLLSLIPLITPMAVYGESDQITEQVTRMPSMKKNADSWRASQVMGVSVSNTSDENMGEVKDLVLDMKNGEILAVIISSGGFLGVADTLSAIPVQALWYDVDAKAFKTKLTKEQLGKAPQFKTNAWPNYRDGTTLETLRLYRDAISGDVTAADNSAQNEKEIDQNAVNPTDQGNSNKDLQITKDIRAEIMSHDLSFNTKNIKIITKDECVTLKGVVASQAEHQAVLKIAKNHADSAKIIDDLKVKDN